MMDDYDDDLSLDGKGEEGKDAAAPAAEQPPQPAIGGAIRLKGMTPIEEEHDEPEENEEPQEERDFDSEIFTLRTTANREDQVVDFISTNAVKKKLAVYSLIRPHGMRGYIFIEAKSRLDAEQAAYGVPYARGILPQPVDYREIEHMLEQGKREMNIRKSDIVEIISGPFKMEKAKISRIDKTKEEVIVELLEAAVPIPITLKMDSVKVIRRDTDDDDDEDDDAGMSPGSGGIGPLG
ncbi:transcription elongation factor Spt5 [Candidatus Woesearchaeota archaeon]|nr:transcription elongation factor Spt5 [Candidatus Woesearchaeota archaeon]